MLTTTIQSLHIYPIKSMSGVKVDTISLGMFGPQEDRRYMLVNQQGRFITQRSHPILAQFKLRPVANGWHVEFKDESIVIDDEASTDRLIDTRVWKSPIHAREKSQDVSQWFSRMLDEWVTLVEFDDLERRVRSIDGHEYPFAFADGYPLLVCNESSLLDLNLMIQESLTMTRFRPNVVIDLPPKLEYDCRALSLSDDQKVLLAEPCKRCNVPAIDPLTSAFSESLFKTMNGVLSEKFSKPVFGMNAVTVGLTELKVGQTFEVDTLFED